MTADLDLSPEAVERLARNMELLAERSGFNAADWERGAATLRALASERDAAWQAGAEATYAVKVAADGTCSFKCPRCGQRHTHGAPDREQVAEHRQAHCANAEVHHPKGYFIVAASRPRVLLLPGQPKGGE